MGAYSYIIGRTDSSKNSFPFEGNYPYWEVADRARRFADVGCKIFQKFTCADCGEHMVMEVPNVLYKTGQCDICGNYTDIEDAGCNFIIE